MSGVITSPRGFDYAALPADLANDARQIAARIKGRITTGFLATGHDLLDMKDRLGHGRFGAWLDAEFGMTARTAERYMAAARFDTANSDTMSHLLPATLHALAAPSLPDDVRVSCVERIKAGAKLRPRDVADAAAKSRHEATERALQAKSLPRGKAAREAAIAAMQAKQEAAERRAEASERARAELVGILVVAIGDEHRARVRSLLVKISGYTFTASLLQGLDSADRSTGVTP